MVEYNSTGGGERLVGSHDGNDGNHGLERSYLASCNQSSMHNSLALSLEPVDVECVGLKLDGSWVIQYQSSNLRSIKK